MYSAFPALPLSLRVLFSPPFCLPVASLAVPPLVAFPPLFSFLFFLPRSMFSTVILTRMYNDEISAVTPVFPRRPLINSYLAFVRLTSGAGSSRHCQAKSCPSCTRRLEIAWEFPRISNETGIVGVFVHIWFAESRVNSPVVMQLFNAGINTFVITCHGGRIHDLLDRSREEIAMFDCRYQDSLHSKNTVEKLWWLIVYSKNHSGSFT